MIRCKKTLRINNINKQNEFNKSILNNNIEKFKLLLNHPNVNPANREGESLHIAAEYGHTHIVELLLKDPRVDPTEIENYSIQIASQNGHLEIVKLLLQDSRVDPSDCLNYAIRFASKNGHLAIVYLLWKNEKVKNTLQKINLKLYNQLNIKDKINNF